MISKYKLNQLAKKYRVKSWFYVSSNTMLDENGKIHSTQMVDDIEDLFRMGEDKVVNIYMGRLDRIGGFITEQ